MATGTAFALAVPAVVGRPPPSWCPAAVGDVRAVLVIVVACTSGLDLAALAGAVVGLVVFGLLQGRACRVLPAPLAVGIWWLAHAFVAHATIGAVVMGLLVRPRPRPGEAQDPACRAE
ncbi:Na+/H+ antiporter 1 [Actinosynnema pretiosum]|nr:Na+/H+ antiporter 1 [Actinosynnema pretiosum]